MTHTPVTPRTPPKIAKAINNIMKKVQRLEKADHNKFSNYDFTSIDDFKDDWRPKIAEEGLIVTPDELAFDFETLESGGEGGRASKKTLCAKIKFQMTVEHIDGEVAAPETITIVLPYTGAQTSGAARSYAVKEWFKAKVLQSSGDQTEEADQRRQDDYQAASGMRMPKKDARPIYERLDKELKDLADQYDPAALTEWAATNKETVWTMPLDWQDQIRRDYDKAMEDAKAREGLDRKPNGNGAHEARQ